MKHPESDVPDPSAGPLFPVKRSGEAGGPLPALCPDCGQPMARVDRGADTNQEPHRCDNPACLRNQGEEGIL